MRRFLLSLISIITFSFTFPVAAPAADDVRVLLKDTFARLEAYRSCSADFVQSINMMGNQMEAGGRFLWRDSREMRMEMEMSSAAGAQQIVMVMGQDGLMWQDMTVGGQRRVMKIDMNQLPAGAMMRMNQNPADQMDPRKQLEQMEKNFDLALVGEDELEGVAVYVIDGTPKTESDNPQLKVIAEQMGRQRIYLGQEDGFARKIETYAKDGQTLVMSMQFKNLKFNEELADSLFAFTPPEGVPVLDMAEMMKRAHGGALPTQPPAAPAP